MQRRRFFIFTVTLLVFTACATVPDSVKIAMQKQGKAIDRVAADYQISVEAYHAELLKHIDARLDDIYRHEVQKLSASSSLTSGKVIALDQQRSEQRQKLHHQAEEVKERLLGSKNLQILKQIHSKISAYIQSERFTAEDFANLVGQVDPLISKIKTPQ